MANTTIEDHCESTTSALQIPGELRDVYSALDRLGSAIDQLVEKTRVICVPEEDDAIVSNSHESQLVPLASEIRAFSDEINMKANFLCGLLDRMEL